MARHLAICERKSAYPSRKEAKQAIVTHSMLDVLGLVRKPEEGPSGLKKISSLPSDAKNEKETIVIDDNNEASLEGKAEDVNCESKEASEKMDIYEITVVNDQDSEKIDKLIEDHLSEKNDKETHKKLVNTQETSKTEDEEIKESDKVADLNQKETINVDEQVANRADEEEIEKMSDKQENESSEEGTNEQPEEPLASSKSPQSETEKHLEIESTCEQSTEKKEEEKAEVEIVEDSTKDENVNENITPLQNNVEEVKPQDNFVEKTESECSVPTGEKIVSDIQEDITEEKEPVGESLAEIEKISSINEIQTAKILSVKPNALDADITSDDIQNIISDVVGEKSDSEIHFDDVQNIDETPTMEMETDFSKKEEPQNLNSSPGHIENFNMQIPQEGMEVPERLDNASMESEVTPMETD